MEFFVTFGTQYRREPHPKVNYADPDGFLVIEAANEGEARQKAFAELGPYWSMLRPLKAARVAGDLAYFPKGELKRI